MNEMFNLKATEDYENMRKLELCFGILGKL